MDMLFCIAQAIAFIVIALLPLVGVLAALALATDKWEY